MAILAHLIRVVGVGRNGEGLHAGGAVALQAVILTCQVVGDRWSRGSRA